MPLRYLLLMRHAAGYKPYHSGVEKEERSHTHPDLLLAGERDVRAVALRLEEIIDYGSEPRITIGAVLHSPRTEAAETARVMDDAVAGLPRAEAIGELDPAEFRPQSGPEAAKALERAARKIEETRAPERKDWNALLVIGHEPQLGWIANEFASRRRLRRRVAIPIARAELACLEDARGSGDWQLSWTIAPDDNAALIDVRDKIKSKMDAAKVFGGFITALLTFVLSQFLSHGDVNDATWVLRVATVALLFAAAALYFSAVFHYDTLLMPPRFWGSKFSSRPRPRWLVARPPSSSAWVLYQNMMRVWARTFVPATVLVGVALVLFAQAILEPSELQDWWPIPAAVVGSIALILWIRASRPRLGAQD